jgi:hypothetical protein
MILLRLSHGLRTILELLAATAHYLFWCLAPEDSKAARITCLTKELAFYRERKIRPRSLTNGARLTFVWLTSRFAVSDVLHANHSAASAPPRSFDQSTLLSSEQLSASAEFLSTARAET